MTKCFHCIKEEYHKKIKWSQVSEALVILNGTGYCYKHLCQEINWKNEFKQSEVKE